MKRKQYAALVVGAGIAGIRSALDLAESGLKVALIDRRPSIGGILSQLDYQFPTDKCGMCKMLPLTSRDDSSQFCMRKGLFHRNIDIMLNTEMETVAGDPGKFHVTLRERSTFVNPERCISCGECAKACPVSIPNEFNAGLTSRGAVYLPVPHAIPNHYVVDLERCTRCWSCFKACPVGAIDFKYSERDNYRIIIAGADTDANEDIAERLTDQNFPLALADSASQAAKAMEEAPARLLLLDLSLGADAEKIMRRGMELHPNLRTVLIITPEQQQQAESLLEQGAAEYIVKPLGKQFVRWLDHDYIRTMSDIHHELEVGSVIVAAGFDCFGGQEMERLYAHGRHPGVVTALEFERMCSGTGPDVKLPRRIAWLQCIGSRNAQRGADFCSGICCMFAVKEARLARKLTGGEAQTDIFYMDMRTYGKGFQRYRDKAQADGVRFIRTRIHSIEPDPNVEGVPIRWMDDDGNAHDDVYDLVVLSTGVRPPAGMERLSTITGMETDEHGFAASPPFQPARTSRLGVFAAGAFGHPRDISESVIQASAAAMQAQRTYSILSPPRDQAPEPEPEYRDVTREAPKTLVAVCTSCPTLELNVNMQSLMEKLKALPTVFHVEAIHNSCSAAGWNRINELAEEHQPNRILIGACMPYAYVPRLRDLGAAIKLDPAFMDVVDIYTPTFPGAMESGAALEREVFTQMAMGVSKLIETPPSPILGKNPVVPRALVVGGGLAGMTASMRLADLGHEVCLVEKAPELGGIAIHHQTTLGGENPHEFMDELVDQVSRHPNIRTFTQSRVMLSMGRSGRFMSMLTTEEGTALTIEHGVTILATGGQEAVPDSYGYRVHKTVMRQSELEAGLADGSIDTGGLSAVAMIQCVESREEPRNYCSRVCCAAALKNALTLKRRNPDLRIYVYYRDLMSYGFMEKFYTQARKLGVIFIRYTTADKPKVTFTDDHKPIIRSHDPILGREVIVEADLLALSVGVVPNNVEDLSEIFRVGTDQDGFLQEAESKWRPVEFLRQGIFLCGMCISPRNMDETIASAEAAAGRAARILAHKTVMGGRITAQVRSSLCSACGRCVEVCPYEARTMDLEKGVAVVDECACQGCGSCAAVCPNSASVLAGFKDGQVMSIIDAALTETT